LDNSSDDIFERIRADYVEMPGMSLRLDQLARLCGIETSVCKRALDALIEIKFLHLRGDGGYARLSPEATHLRTAKAAH
jgi:DNA-binding IclR family transcriptional regulator